MMSNDAAALPFEDALQQLDRTVAELESGALGLDDALARYEQGVRLLARCHRLLDDAGRKVALLTDVDDQGRPLTVPFDAAPTLAADGDGTA